MAQGKCCGYRIYRILKTSSLTASLFRVRLARCRHVSELALGFARPKAAAVCEAFSSVHSLLSVTPFPSLPLPLEVGPLNAARGFGGKLPKGSGA